MKRLTALLILGLPTLAAAEWRGVDLSYVNELTDCGAEYFDADSQSADAFTIFADAGANLVRLRLWVDPDWTEYSTFVDVEKSIRQAKAAGMQVLLDFHYSNDWAHPGKQLRPAGWPPSDDTQALSLWLYEYTRDTLAQLRDKGLSPDVVAVGNEINTDMLIDDEVEETAPINWPRNAQLLNAGIRAVREHRGRNGDSPEVMLHVAQPENVEAWFVQAMGHGVTDFDYIGISYYPKWSSVAFADLGSYLKRFKSLFNKPVSVVETAYPWTLDGNDSAGNLLGADSLVDEFPATADGQAKFLDALSETVAQAGGNGVVYWEPAWISSSCETRWGKGSHWENAALFDFDGRLLPGAGFFSRD